MQILQVRNARALMVPDVQQLFQRVLAKMPLLAPLGLGSIAEDLFTYVTREDYFLLLGAEDSKPVAVLLGHFHQNNMAPYAMIDVMYNEGSPKVSKALREKALEIFTQAGYTKVWAFNMSGKSDKAWEKVMKMPGVAVNRLGSVFEVGVE